MKTSLHIKALADSCELTIVLPILLRREARAAATVTVDLFNSAADIIVADVQHVETRTCAVHQGGAVQKTKTALCECSLHTQNESIQSLWKERFNDGHVALKS